MYDKVRLSRKFIAKLSLSVSTLLISTSIFAAPNAEGIQIYHKNLHISAQHRKKLSEDINRYYHADNIWDVLREEFTLPHYEENPIVQEKIEWFMRNQGYLIRSATRAAPYLYYILQQVKKRHLPAEIVLLPIIESGYNPFSLSNVGAAGIWQLMPNTATGLGIKQNSWYDGRRDLIASTKGALNHLSYLQSFFEGNWLLAFAAYNTGEGNVLTAIKRNIREGRSTNFWSLPVAQQTKDYVPSLLALAIIISNPEQYPIYFPPVKNAPYLAQVDVGKQINLKFAATLAGISYQELIRLNPGFNPSSSAKLGPYKLVLPIENVEQFSENFARSPLNTQLKNLRYKIKNDKKTVLPVFVATKPPVKKIKEPVKDHPFPIFEIASAYGSYNLQPGDTIYLVRPQDTLGSIARHFQMNPQMILAVNHLTERNLKPGQQLIIPTHPVNPPTPALQPGDTIYMVRSGDTIETIAEKFHTTPAAIRLSNLVDNSSLQEGEKLVVPTHLRG